MRSSAVIQFRADNELFYETVSIRYPRYPLVGEGTLAVRRGVSMYFMVVDFRRFIFTPRGMV